MITYSEGTLVDIETCASIYGDGDDVTDQILPSHVCVNVSGDKGLHACHVSITFTHVP